VYLCEVRLCVSIPAKISKKKSFMTFGINRILLAAFYFSISSNTDVEAVKNSEVSTKIALRYVRKKDLVSKKSLEKVQSLLSFKLLYSAMWLKFEQ
jgi:hypothetical protein